MIIYYLQLSITQFEQQNEKKNRKQWKTYRLLYLRFSLLQLNIPDSHFNICFATRFSITMRFAEIGLEYSVVRPILYNIRLCVLCTAVSIRESCFFYVGIVIVRGL